MKTANCRDWGAVRQTAQTYNEIIYLYGRPEEHCAEKSRTKTGRKKRSGDVFWNVFFAVMCLSALAILFML